MLWPLASVICALGRRPVTESTAWPRSLCWEQTERLSRAEPDLRLTDASSSTVFVSLQCRAPLKPPEHREGVQDVMGQLL